jgi:hypothetical protein
MSRLPVLYRWLTLAALADWLIGRTMMRLAIFMPKSLPIIVVYQMLGYIGQFAATLISVLALCGVGWLAWRAVRVQRQFALPLVLSSLLALSLALLVVAPTGPLLLGYHLFLMAAVLLFGWQVWEGNASLAKRAAGTAVALAILFGELYQLLPALYETLRWPGPPPFASAFFNLGELFVVLSSMALWWAYGRGATWRVWLAAVLPALAFVVFRFANPAMTGIIAIWSMGLTLYLPWPVYALGLWLTGVTVIRALRQGNVAGWAILLLMAGGYAPQLSTHAFLGLLAQWMLALPTSQLVTSQAARGLPQLQPQQANST